MGELGVIKNDLGHVRRSLDGLHRKADKANGCIGEHSGRLTALETKDVVSTAECSERRLSATKRALATIVALLGALVTGWILNALAGGGGGP